MIVELEVGKYEKWIWVLVGGAFLSGDEKVTTLNDKQTQVDRDNLWENSRCTAHDYAVGEQVFVKIKGVKRKLDPPKKGPYTITDVYTNGTVRIQRGIINERINIRRLEPFFE